MVATAIQQLLRREHSRKKVCSQRTEHKQRRVAIVQRAHGVHHRLRGLPKHLWPHHPDNAHTFVSAPISLTHSLTPHPLTHSLTHTLAHSARTRSTDTHTHTHIQSPLQPASPPPPPPPPHRIIVLVHVEHPVEAKPAVHHELALHVGVHASVMQHAVLPVQARHRVPVLPLQLVGQQWPFADEHATERFHFVL